MPKQRVVSSKVPEAEGRYYSQAIQAGGFLFISGQVPLDDRRRLVANGDPAGQTRQALENLRHLCEAAGATLDDVVKLNVYLRDVADAAAIRPVRLEFFTGADYPAVTLIGNVALADPEWLVEIEAVVALR